jgi:hypothetical protein
MREGQMYQISRACFAGLVIATWASFAGSQTIDFETLPGGAATTDNMLIDAQYEAEFGVRFSLIDRVTGAHAGFPRIAKVGSPLTAFVSCQGDDTPDSGLGVGSSFLTDDGVLGNSADLLVEYFSPVREASGIILDVDARSSLPGAVEGWLIQAFSSSGEVLEFIQIFAPQGPDEPGCDGYNGEGDGSARGFSFSRINADIASLQFSYIGNAKLGSVGLAFDNFSPSTAVEELEVEIVQSSGEDLCIGSSVFLGVNTTGGFSDQTVRWERRLSQTDPWEETSISDIDGEYFPVDGEQVRVLVDDGSIEVASDPIEFDLAPREVEVQTESEAFGWALTLLYQNNTPPQIWGDDPTSFENDDIETVSEGVHIVPMVTASGAHLAVIFNTTGGSTPGTVRTEVISLGFEPELVFVDDPDDPMYNDTYSEKLLAPGMKQFVLDQTWAGNKTDGFIIGPLVETGSLSISFTQSVGLSTGLIMTGVGESYPFDYVDGMQLTFENSCSESCIADLNGDGQLNFFDVSAFLVAFQMSDPIADFNGDGMLNFFDVSAFLTAFNAGCP